MGFADTGEEDLRGQKDSTSSELGFYDHTLQVRVEDSAKPSTHLRTYAYYDTIDRS